MSNKQLKVKCLNCGSIIDIDLCDYDLSWEMVEADSDRGMGTEFNHEAVVEVECDDCNADISITLNVWEYPEGSSNSQEIEVDGGDLISGCDLSDIAPIGDVPDND